MGADAGPPGPAPGADGPDPALIEGINAIVAGAHYNPHAILGAHPGPDGVTIRALRPLAETVEVMLPDGRRVPMSHLHEGVFAVTLPGAAVEKDEVPDYLIAARYPAGPGIVGPEVITDDPYRHLPTLGDIDLHLIGEGRHEELWLALGAQVRGEAGTSFAVWAPSARGVRVIGEFNHWDGRAHPMRSLGRSGVWELYIPGIGPGMTYKYDICGPDGTWQAKADPLAKRAQVPPATASVVFASEHEWSDRDWLALRAERDPLTSPMSIYEVHLGSWRPGLSYTELAEQLTAYVRQLGFTHVEFLPVAEHPFGGSWGYQVTSYYAPTSRFGSPDEFRYLIDRLHQAGVGVLVDWVPAHFPRDIWALARFDGTPLYEHPDPRRGEHPDWGTLIFNYGRLEVRNFLVANALFWLREYHIDGLRVDAVASMLYLDYSRKAGEWVPNSEGGRENLDAVAFLREANAACYRAAPGTMMIAEESTAWPGVTRPVYLGGLGFGLKWNMGWMHDTLAYLARDPVYRSFHHDEITFSMIYAYSENYVLPLSHDEVVHGKRSLLRKMAGDEWKQFAGLRALLAYMWAHPGKQLLFMGGEIAQGDEWSEETGIQWHLLDYPGHSGVQRLVTDLNRAYAEHPALWRQDAVPAGFSWIDANDTANNVLSFVRRAGSAPEYLAQSGGLLVGAPPEGVMACIVNFSGEPHHGYRVGLPQPGRWQELVNTDAEVYGGSNVGNLGGVLAEPVPWHGLPASAEISIPPLAALWLTPEDPR